MNAELITVAIFLIGAIFAAGKLVSKNNSDINRLGAKMREKELADFEREKTALRRHYNMSLMMVASEEDREKRFRIAGQLREDG